VQPTRINVATGATTTDSAIDRNSPPASVIAAGI
jgi:hypothetical protein